jgi:hypothetical protein
VTKPKPIQGEPPVPVAGTWRRVVLDVEEQFLVTPIAHYKIISLIKESANSLECSRSKLRFKQKTDYLPKNTNKI